MNFKLTSITLLMALAFFSCSDPVSEGESTSQISLLKNSEKIDSKTKTEILEQIKGLSLPPTASFLIQKDVEFYKINFTTHDFAGKEVIASGTVAIPVSGENIDTLRIFSYQHGTIFKWDDVSSQGGFTSGDGFISMLGSSMGLAFIAPDYIGLGDSKNAGRAFMHSASAGKQGRDFVIAATEFLKEKNIAFRSHISLLGYSEGGFATLAMQKEIETNPISGIEISGSAPMAGPYDLSGTMFEQMMAEERLPYAPYFPYTLDSYNRIYNIWPSASDYLADSLASFLPELLEGDYDGDAIDERIPATSQEILLNSVLEAIKTDENHPLRIALKENDLWNYTPSSPTRFYHCEADRTIPIANAEKAVEYMSAQGADVELKLAEGTSHSNCAIDAITSGLIWLLSTNPAKN